jgi:hypothetical protein
MTETAYQNGIDRDATEIQQSSAHVQTDSVLLYRASLIQSRFPVTIGFIFR